MAKAIRHCAKGTLIYGHVLSGFDQGIRISEANGMLAEGVSSRSAPGARLESLSPDEGFGTLDPETLETVAGAVKELGSKGRMIGVITHVRDFAERLPARF